MIDEMILIDITRRQAIDFSSGLSGALLYGQRKHVTGTDAYRRSHVFVCGARGEMTGTALLPVIDLTIHARN